MAILFMITLESFSYYWRNTRFIKGELYQKLGFESLQQRRWYSKLCSFYKVFKNKSLRYLFNIIPIRSPAYSTRNHVNIPLFKTNHNFFKNSFFPPTIIEWNNLDPNLRNSDTYGTFKSTILKFIRLSPKSVFECHNPQVIKFLTTLCLQSRRRLFL